MKDEKTTIRSLLGLTQEEMAILLKVSRQHFSLYELGLRSLPLEASQLIADLLAHRKTALAKAEKAKKRAPQNQELQEHVNALLRENNYQQQTIARRIATLERKQLAVENKALIADFIDKRKADASKAENVRFHIIANNIAKSQNAATEMELMKLRVSLELLEVEGRFLEGKGA